MKVLVIFSLLFIYTQADIDPNETLAKTAMAVRDCVKEKNLNGGKILKIMTKNVLPTDDPEFLDFFTCYYEKLGILKDGKLDQGLIQQLLPVFIKHKFGEDVDAEKLAREAKEHCKDIQDDKVILRAIKVRNCGLQYAEEHK